MEDQTSPGPRARCARGCLSQFLLTQHRAARYCSVGTESTLLPAHFRQLAPDSELLSAELHLLLVSFGISLGLHSPLSRI